jgi:hypothetical protein
VYIGTKNSLTNTDRVFVQPNTEGPTTSHIKSKKPSFLRFGENQENSPLSFAWSIEKKLSLLLPCSENNIINICISLEKDKPSIHDIIMSKLTSIICPPLLIDAAALPP